MEPKEALKLYTHPANQLIARLLWTAARTCMKTAGLKL
jgi:hypothetical protein